MKTIKAAYSFLTSPIEPHLPEFLGKDLRSLVKDVLMKFGTREVNSADINSALQQTNCHEKTPHERESKESSVEFKGIPLLAMRDAAVLNGEVRDDLLLSLAEQGFTYTSFGKFQPIDYSIKSVQIENKKSHRNDPTLVVFTPRPRDRAISMFDLSLSVYTDKSKSQRFEIRDIPIVLEETTESERRLLKGDRSFVGAIIFRGLLTGACYRVVTTDSEGVPSALPVPQDLLFSQINPIAERQSDQVPPSEFKETEGRVDPLKSAPLRRRDDHYRAG